MSVASTVTNRHGQSLVSVLVGMSAVSAIAIAAAVIPVMMSRSVSRNSAESANQMIGGMMWHMVSLPEICDQLISKPLPQVGTPVNLPTMEFGQFTLTPGTEMLGIRMTSLRLERLNSTALPPGRAVIKVIVTSQRIGSSASSPDLYSSEVLLPVTFNGSGSSATISACLIPNPSAGGSSGSGSGGGIFTMQQACEDMGGVWRELGYNAGAEACAPPSTTPDPNPDIDSYCPHDALGNRYIFDVVLPIGLFHPTLNPALGACDYVAGLCRSMGARVSRIVKWNEVEFGPLSTTPLNPPSGASGNPSVATGNSAAMTVRVTPGSPPTITAEICDPVSEPTCQWNAGQLVSPDQMSGFATMCKAQDVEMAFFQPLASDGGCPGGEYVIGFNRDGSVRCSGGNGGGCTRTGSCLRPALIQGRCRSNSTAAYTLFVDGVASRLVCADEPDSFDPLNPTVRLPFCVDDLPNVSENRCPP